MSQSTLSQTPGVQSTGDITYWKFWTDPKIQSILILMSKILFGLVIVSIIGWFIGSQFKNTDTIVENKEDRGLTILGFQDYGRKYEGFAKNPNADVKEDEEYLVNYAYLTGNVAGFIGPISNGFFSQSDYLKKAMSMGVRGFVLPISQHFDDNKTAPNWPETGKPGVFARSKNNEIITQNGMTIRNFCRELLIANAGSGPYAKEPILLYLQEQSENVPDKNKEEDAYVRFMSEIAEDLGNSLDRVNNDGSFTETGVRLTRLPVHGSCVRAERQTELLTEVPKKDLAGKILIFTNFDWKREQKDAYINMKRPRLGDYINFQYHPAKETSCVSIHLDETTSDQLNWSDRSFTKYTMTLKDSPLEVPEFDKVQAALAKGIQTIPLPLVFLDGSDKEKANTIAALWQNQAYLVKPKGIRFRKPKPIEPAQPSQRLNARVAPNLQPGQTRI